METNVSAQEKTVPPSKLKKVFFWIFTALVVFELLLGATWDFNWVNKSFVRNIMGHLGFPSYFDTLLGLAKIPAAIVILIPGFAILKEWAYAGAVFIFAGAAFCHLAAGDAFGVAVYPAIYVAMCIGSRALRPANRRI